MGTEGKNLYLLKLSRTCTLNPRFPWVRTTRYRPKNKNKHSGPSVNISILTVGQVEQFFKPYRMMFKELRGNKITSHHNVSAKKETLKMY
jgi:hypothetical protein